MTRAISPEERLAIHHLLWVWTQYGDSGTPGVLAHHCATAGEEAADYLESLGLGVNTGWGFELNEAGKALMKGEGL